MIISRLQFFKSTGISLKVLSLIFIAKILSGIALLLIYKFYYGTNGSDIFNYFKDGQVIYKVSETSFVDYLKLVSGIGSYSQNLEPYLRENTDYWFKAFNYNLLNDNRLVIRINAVLHFISNNNIFVHSVFFSFFSFVGLTALYKVFNKAFSNKNILIVIVFFIPSVMIWSSALLKESVLMLSLGVLLLSFFNLLNNKKLLINILLLLLSTFFMFILKFYVLFSLIPGLIFLIINKFYSKNSLVVFVVVYIFSILLFFNFQYISNYNLAEIISFKQHDFINMVNESVNVGSRIDIPILEPNFLSFVTAIPTALLNTFLRPSIFDVHSVIVIPSVIENFLFIIMVVFTIIYFNKSLLKKNLTFILFSLSFVVTLSLLIGLTTPVLGAIVRYKVPYLPFLILILMLTFDIQNFKNNKFFKYFIKKIN